jgi:diguanylate cyclase
MMFHHAGQQFRVTVSAGVCKWTRSVSSMRAMMAEADKAMYQAKRSGRNRVCVAR